MNLKRETSTIFVQEVILKLRISRLDEIFIGTICTEPQNYIDYNLSNKFIIIIILFVHTETFI